MGTNGTNVLVVEDNEKTSVVLQQLLTKQGYIVERAADGMEAMEKVLNKAYDIIVTDLAIPLVSGFQLIEAVRRNLYNTVKIVVVTSSDNEHTVSKAFSLGADDYLKKPIMPNELLTRLKRLV